MYAFVVHMSFMWLQYETAYIVGQVKRYVHSWQEKAGSGGVNTNDISLANKIGFSQKCLSLQ